jgi:anti-anti-sigma regulatory factor
MDTGWDDGEKATSEGWDEGPPAMEDSGEADDGWNAADEADGTDVAEEGLIRLGAKPDAAALRDALLALEDLGAARVDASEVERLPGPAFQILLIAMRDALFAGGKIRVVNPSFAFGLCFEAFGLGGDLEPFQAEYV